MRPRLIGRGFDDHGSTSRMARLRFNEAASDRTRISPWACSHCGREQCRFNEAASDRTRIFNAPHIHSVIQAASMRPRLIGRGFQGAGVLVELVGVASMRPRLIGRGFAACGFDSSSCKDCFNEAASDRTRI